jgi:hypothetical protein
MAARSSFDATAASPVVPRLAPSLLKVEVNDFCELCISWVARCNDLECSCELLSVLRRRFIVVASVDFKFLWRLCYNTLYDLLLQPNGHYFIICNGTVFTNHGKESCNKCYIHIKKCFAGRFDVVLIEDSNLTFKWDCTTLETSDTLICWYYQLTHCTSCFTKRPRHIQFIFLTHFLNYNLSKG